MTSHNRGIYPEAHPLVSVEVLGITVKGVKARLREKCRLRKGASTGNKSNKDLVISLGKALKEHPSETMVFHNEDGNPARANIKQALGSYEYLIKGVKASANSDIMYFFTRARDAIHDKDNGQLSLADDSRKLKITIKDRVTSIREICLGDDIDLHPNLNFTFISDRQKGIIPAIKTVYPSAKYRYCLRHIHENMKHEWCGQAYKDLLWRAASAINVRDFEKCRAKSDLLLNKICEVFNGKIVRGRDKPVITLFEYIREYCMKRIVNVQGVIDKCTGPLTPTATGIMKYELTGIPCKHVVAACWNMALNDRAAPTPKTWVGRPRKKRKRSKHEDEPFVKDGKLSRKERTITCQSCENTRHNKATCKGQGRKATIGGNNAEASDSASRQAQQTKPAAGQDSSGGSGAGTVIGLSTAAGEGGQGGFNLVPLVPNFADNEQTTPFTEVS
ncbi:crooked neck-like protein 1 [Tanacetum coccineum]